MAQECGFFNSKLMGEEYDRVYLAEQFAAYFAAFIGNGVYGHSMQKLQILCQDVPNMSVKVLSGEAYINGWWYRNTDTYNLTVPIADGALSRIDIVVLRWGSSERDMWLEVIPGTPSVNPVRPSMRRDADYYDLMIGYISIPAGAIKVTQAQITDTRLDNSVCGLVTGVVDQIDTTNLYNQFTAYFNEFKQNQEADFNNWSAQQKQEYLDYVAYQKGLYDRYIAELQADYDTWTDDKKAEWTDWVSQQEAEFTQWVLNEKIVYDTWTDAQRQSYTEWYNVHTVLWEKMFNDWFDTIKGKLTSDVAGSLQEQLLELQARLPVVEVANINHNKNAYVHCDLYEVDYTCGTQGYGEGPAGGGPLVSSPVEYEMPDKNWIKIRAIDGLGTVGEVKELEPDAYSIVFENNIKALLAIIDDRK